MRERVRKGQTANRSAGHHHREYGDYNDWTGRMDLEDPVMPISVGGFGPCCKRLGSGGIGLVLCGCWRGDSAQRRMLTW